MVKTEYYCDRCKKQIPAGPMTNIFSVRIDTEGWTTKSGAGGNVHACSPECLIEMLRSYATAAMYPQVGVNG